ncbi:probable L-type lectin-domain containing receptor kinase S.7 [Lycium barbarum]|uniref:probable L-type lectin-domain containing receptor kinase S.7 n=1 Tax=Lycium barbarum TaxID=112863 RepID=UPI00293E3208|nr:probable L-type lectin-domain containing receptor kinase S.7 [Lycium barbarum]
MGNLSAFRYLIVLVFYFCFYLRSIQSEEQDFSFDFENFGKDSNFESQFALYGDAKVVNGGGIQMSGSMGFSAGRILNKNPIKLLEKNPRKMVSFSMHFVFSLSSENGDGFAFVMVPVGYPFDEFDGGSFGLLGVRKMKFLAVEFDTFMDEKYGDVNGNHVGVDLSSFMSVKVSNVSLGLMNSGEKIQSWIDYEASSKRLEVRLSKLGDIRSLNPLLSCFIDLPAMFKDDELFVWLSSSSGNSTQKCNIYSWGFKTRTAPHWMHSEPLDPQSFGEEKKEEMKVHSKSDCALRILGALLFGTGCGALGAFIVIIVWTLLGSRRPVAPEDSAEVMEHNSKEFDGYKKFKVVVVDNAIKDGK